MQRSGGLELSIHTEAAHQRDPEHRCLCGRLRSFRIPRKTHGLRPVLLLRITQIGLYCAVCSSFGLDWWGEHRFLGQQLSVFGDHEVR